jgi:hypothetical protein
MLREDHPAEILGGLLLFLFGVAWHINEMEVIPVDRADAGALAAVFGLVPCCFLCAFEGNRAIPARGTTAMEVLLSAPIGGWRIVSGSVLATLLRFRFALIVYLAMGIMTPRDLHAARGPAFILLAASFLALAHAIGLWTRFIGPSRVRAFPLVVCVCAALGMGTAVLWPEGAFVHPVLAWYSSDAASICLSGGMNCAAALLLCGVFAARFRTIAALVTPGDAS